MTSLTAALRSGVGASETTDARLERLLDREMLGGLNVPKEGTSRSPPGTDAVKQ